MLAAMLRFALQILVSDNKDKSLDIINLFYKDRKEDETTHQAELTYRKQVEKLTKEGDIYRIRYVCWPSTSTSTFASNIKSNIIVQTRSTKAATLQIFKKDDKTYEADELAAHARWSYYISTFSMRDLTEGIPLPRLSWPFLRRNMPAMLETEEEYINLYSSPQWNEDELVIRISPGNYKMLYDPGTSDWWVHNVRIRKRGMSACEEVCKERQEKFEQKFGEKGILIAQGSELDKANADFKQWVQNGPVTEASAGDDVNGKADDGGLDGTDDGDEVMGGT